MSSVVAVVLTFERRERLARVLDGLTRQTHPVDHVLVVDNASTDGTCEHVLNLARDLLVPVTVLRMARNGGSAEGYHAALGWCLRAEAEWAWLVEDDLVTRADTLELLLTRPEATSPDTAALVSAIDAPGGGVLLVPRGTLAARYGGTPCHPVPSSRYDDPVVRVEYFGYLGSLLRLDAVRTAGLPNRELLGWVDDVEFSSRLTQVGAAWLVPSSRILHDDGMPATEFGAGVRDRLRRLRQEPPLAAMWRNAYGLRNLVWWGRRAGFVGRRHAFVYWLLLAGRALVFAPDHRILRARIYSRMVLDGWRGTLRSPGPAEWAHIGSWRGSVARFLDRYALRYDTEAVAKTIAAGPIA